jgi:type IV pilus assembly protein PilQ
MYDEKKSENKIANRRKLLVWCLVLAVMAAIAFGDVAQYAREDESELTVGDVGTSEVVSVDKTIQSITFKKNISIRDALRFLAVKYEKNIVPSPSVDGVLSFTSLFEVTFEEAMDAILGGAFEYEQKGNLIEVFPKGDKSRMKYAVFALRYISAAEAQKLIMPVLSSNGTVGVTSPAETGVPTGESISAPKGGGDTMSLRDTIVIYDYAENIRRAKEVISTIDVRPKQVLVEATILSATLTEDTQFGIDWQSLKGIAVTQLSGISAGDPDYLKSVGTTFGGATTKSGGMTVGLALGDVGTFIRAVEQVSDVTILANPKILAVNKQLGQVYIGDKIGYNSQTTVAESGTSTSQVNFLDTGTKLSFRPYISTEGYVRMDIHAKNSAEKSGGVISETSTELISNVMVKDGQMIVIGGLFQDTVDTSRTQVPLLGDIPVVGGAFRGTADQYVRKEVMVLLVPHIIEEPEEAGGEARAADVSRKRYGARMGLQGISRTRLAEDHYAKAARYYADGNSIEALSELDDALDLRPSYLEALRLKESIIAEVSPDQVGQIERIMMDVIEREQASKWRRY